MTKSLVVIGAGGFGRETLDVIEAINASGPVERYRVLGVADKSPSNIDLERLVQRGIAYLGTEEEWIDSAPDASYVLAVGSPNVRRSLAHLLSSRGVSAETLIHPSAGVGSAGALGAGSVICSGVQVSTNVRLGEHVHLNPNATVGHDTTIEDFVSVNPGAIISGNVTLRTGVLVGAGAVVLQGLTVHRDSVVGAAACVVRDVVSGTVVKGVPAH